MIEVVLVYVVLLMLVVISDFFFIFADVVFASLTAPYWLNASFVAFVCCRSRSLDDDGLDQDAVGAMNSLLRADLRTVTIKGMVFS